MFVFIDLDGTVCNARARFAAAGPEPERSDKEAYTAWVNKVQSHESLLKDHPVPAMKDLVSSLSRNYKCYYLTARNEEYRQTTLNWLYEHKFPSLNLIMRGTEDWSSSGDYKKKAIQDVAQKHFPILVIDDDPLGDIEEMCKEQGYTFLKAVGYGY